MFDQIETTKGANQLWKESGSSLSFAEWIDREKNKDIFIPNMAVKDSLSTIRIMTGLDANPGLVAADSPQKTIMGLSRPVVYGAIIAIAMAGAYAYYKNRT